MKTWNSPLGDHLYVGAGNDTYRLPGRGGFDATVDAIGNDSDGGDFVKASHEAGTRYLPLNGRYVNGGERPSAPDLINGRGGADSMVGGGGNDGLAGGAGADLIDAGVGDDYVVSDRASIATPLSRLSLNVAAYGSTFFAGRRA